jgi:hypothetical protein
MRRELEVVPLRRLARKPTKILSDQFQKLYQSFEKMSAEAMAKCKQLQLKPSPAELSNGDSNNLVKDAHTDVSQSSSDAVLHQNGDSNSKFKSDELKEAMNASAVGGGAGVVVLD